MRTQVAFSLTAFASLITPLGCSSEVGVSQLRGKTEVPELIDFKDVQVGIVATHDLSIKNTGNGAFNVTRVELADTLSSSSYEFKVPVTPFDLAPGQTKSLTVSFQPFATMSDPVESYFVIHTDIAVGKNTPPLSFKVRVRGRGVNSGLEVMPNPVDFGRVLVGSTRTMDIQITNRLPMPSDVITRLGADGKAQITTQGGLGRFELLSPVTASGSIIPPNPDGTPGVLQPDGSITVQVRYIPDVGQEDREDKGRWSIANCSSPLCNVDIQLKGTGTNAALACRPPAIEFGEVNPNLWRTLTSTCSNVATEMVTITGWQAGPGTSPEYTVTPYTGIPAALPPGAEFKVEVKFSPTDATVGRNPVGSVYINGRNPRANRDLTPTRVGITGDAGGPHIVVSPLTVNFGSTAIGTVNKRRILVQNTGYGPLVVSTVDGDSSRTGVFSTDFSGMVTVLPGASRLIEASFQPTLAADYSSNVVISSNDTLQPTVSVLLQGVGVALPPCNYHLSPSQINFGIVHTMNTRAQGFVVENVGTNDCLMNNTMITPGSSGAFTLDPGVDGVATIAPGRSRTVAVHYAPMLEAVDRGSVSFYISDPSNSNPQVDLHGVGSMSALLITPTELDFGRIGLDCNSRERAVTVFNVGGQPTTLVNIERAAGSSANFTLRNPPGIPPGITLPAGQSTQFFVRYRVNDAHVDTGAIHVFEAGRTDPYVVPLVGEGSTNPTNTDRFRQLQTPQVDILFVVDNSGSMANKQAELARNFHSFIQFASNQGLDYHIGVVTTDIDPPLGVRGCPNPAPADRPMRLDQGQCGYLADGSRNNMMMDPSWRVITPQTRPSPEIAFQALVNQGINGSAFEKGLEVAYHALSSPIIGGWNSRFIRPTAYLAIVIVSDDDDARDDGTGRTDPRAPSVDFYVNYFLAIKGFSNTNLFSLSAIVEPLPNGCGDHSGEAAGIRYTQTAQRTGGVIESICPGTDWSRSLQNLGLSVFGYRSRFFLSNQPVPGSVEVRVNGVRIDATAPTGQVRWTFDSAANSVNFAALAIPEPGSDIVITYAAQCL